MLLVQDQVIVPRWEEEKMHCWEEGGNKLHCRNVDVPPLKDHHSPPHHHDRHEMTTVHFSHHHRHRHSPPSNDSLPETPSLVSQTHQTRLPVVWDPHRQGYVTTVSAVVRSQNWTLNPVWWWLLVGGIMKGGYSRT